jgi:hypothetical protein
LIAELPKDTDGMSRLRKITILAAALALLFGSLLGPPLVLQVSLIVGGCGYLMFLAGFAVFKIPQYFGFYAAALSIIFVNTVSIIAIYLK